MTDPPVELVSCPLCGNRFPARESCPEGCPLARACRTFCCPSCHYRFVEHSRLADWLRRVLPGERR